MYTSIGSNITNAPYIYYHALFVFSELEREIESLGGEQKKLDVKVSNQKIEQDKIYFSQQEAERKRASNKAQAERQRAEDAYNQEREEIERRQRASEQRAVDEYPYSYVLA